MDRNVKTAPISPALKNFLVNEVGLTDRILQAAQTCPVPHKDGAPETNEQFAARITGEALSDIPPEIAEKGQAISASLKKSYGDFKAVDVISRTVESVVGPALDAARAERGNCR